jgi:hypothetical protein
MAEMYGKEFEVFKKELFDVTHYEARRIWDEIEKTLFRKKVEN